MTMKMVEEGRRLVAARSLAAVTSAMGIGLGLEEETGRRFWDGQGGKEDIDTYLGVLLLVDILASEVAQLSNEELGASAVLATIGNEATDIWVEETVKEATKEGVPA